MDVVDDTHKKNVYYVYCYLDPRYRGNFIYDDMTFEYEPFYIGKGSKKKEF